MTQEHLQRGVLWLDALRSGEYKQTRRVLRDESGYCCLGVACDIFAKATHLKRGWSEKVEGFSDGDLVSYLFGPNRGMPTPDATKWFGWSAAIPVVNVEGELIDATALNDTLKFDFAKIADLVERDVYFGFKDLEPAVAA